MMVAEWYPVMLNMEGQLCVVFGGGRVAERKAEGLLQAGARVRVISPTVTEELSRLAEGGRLEWLPREAAASDLEGALLAFAATDRSGVNREMTAAARGVGVPINVADDGDVGDFILPAVLRRGGFVLTAGVSGAGPALAVRVIRELAGRYGPEYTEYTAALRRIRDVVKSRVSDPEQRRRLLSAAATADALEEWRSAARLEDPEWVLERLRNRAAMGNMDGPEK